MKAFQNVPNSMWTEWMCMHCPWPWRIRWMGQSFDWKIDINTGGYIKIIIITKCKLAFRYTLHSDGHNAWNGLAFSVTRHLYTKQELWHNTCNKPTYLSKYFFSVTNVQWLFTFRLFSNRNEIVLFGYLLSDVCWFYIWSRFRLRYYRN